MTPDISIIVPIYNVEKYLPKCIESIRKQTHKNIEIILVDDESPDMCGKMIEEYAKNDFRIKTIHQKNKWLGGARNSGLKIATGKYICFVDSDDYINENLCEELYDFIEKQKLDFAFFDFYNVSQNGDIKSVSKLPFKARELYSGGKCKDILFNLIIRTHDVNSACMKIYRKDVLINNNMFFDEKIRYAEDYEYCLRLFPHINSFAYFNKPLYYYVENNTSIMHTTDSEMINKFVNLYELREQFLKNENIDTEENRRYSAELLINMVVKSLNRYLGDAKTNLKEKNIRDIVVMYQNRFIRQALKKIELSKMNLGVYGKLIIWAIKYKKPKIIYYIYKIYNRRMNK